MQYEEKQSQHTQMNSTIEINIFLMRKLLTTHHRIHQAAYFIIDKLLEEISTLPLWFCFRFVLLSFVIRQSALCML